MTPHALPLSQPGACFRFSQPYHDPLRAPTTSFTFQTRVGVEWPLPSKLGAIRLASESSPKSWIAAPLIVERDFPIFVDSNRKPVPILSCIARHHGGGGMQ